MTQHKVKWHKNVLTLRNAKKQHSPWNANPRQSREIPATSRDTTVISLSNQIPQTSQIRTFRH